MSPVPEEVDLDPKNQAYVDEVYERLDELTHYELLGVRRDADKKEIKRRYFDLVNVVHPDRYYGKRLGGFKPKMEALFARVSQAYETLSSAEARAEYDASLDEAAAEAAEARAASDPRAEPAERPAQKVPVDPRAEARRREAMAALKARFDATRAKADEHVRAAERAHAAGDLTQTLRSYEAALALRDDPVVRAAYQDLKRTEGERLADAHVKKALVEERFGRWGEAAASWRRVLDSRPNDAAARDRLEIALSRAARAAGR